MTYLGKRLLITYNRISHLMVPLFIRVVIIIFHCCTDRLNAWNACLRITNHAFEVVYFTFGRRLKLNFATEKLHCVWCLLMIAVMISIARISFSFFLESHPQKMYQSESPVEIMLSIGKISGSLYDRAIPELSSERLFGMIWRLITHSFNLINQTMQSNG